MNSPPPARLTSSPATPPAPPSPPQPPPKPVVVATFTSAVIEAKASLPPEFTVTVPLVLDGKGKPVQEQPMLAIEFCTDDTFTGTPRRTPHEKLRYFNTALGLNEVGDAGLRVGPIVLQANRGGVKPSPGPAGTVRLGYILDRQVWTEFNDNDEVKRLYYRVYATDGKQRTSSWTKSREQAGPPFIVVLRDKASGPGVSLPQKPALKLDKQGRVLPPKRSVGTQAYTLQGVNLSGMQHRQFNWGTPIAGAKAPNCTTKLMPGSSDPPPATHCPVPSKRWHEAAGISKELFAQLKAMKCNVVRVTFNQDWALNGLAPPTTEGVAPLSNEEYLRDLDQVIAWAHEHDMYVILAMHTLRVILKPDGFFERIYEAHLPDALSVTCWNLLSRRYSGAPAIIFDLCNEPHEVVKDKDEPCYTGLTPAKFEGWIELWHDWVRLLEEGLHGKEAGHAERLVMVSGMHGAGRSASLRQMPVRRKDKPLPNIIYAAHSYTDYEEPQKNVPGGDELRHWLDIGADNAAKEDGSVVHSVFVAEWGPSHKAMDSNGKWAVPAQQKRVDKLTKLLKAGAFGKAAYLVGWAAWAFGDGPPLEVRSARDIRCCGSDLSKKIEHTFVTVTKIGGVEKRELTEWGKVVQGHLNPGP